MFKTYTTAMQHYRPINATYLLPRNANRYKTSHLRERAANVLQIWK